MKTEELKTYIQIVSKERQLPVETVRRAVEQALLQASQRILAKYLNPVIEIDPETYNLKLLVEKVIVPKVTLHPDTEISVRDAARMGLPDAQPGETVQILKDKDYKISGRLLAQQAHQFILIKLREAVQERILKDFAGKIGKLVIGKVESVERDYFVLRLQDGNEASLPFKQMLGNPRHYKLGDQIKAMVWMIDPTITRGPIILTTRTEKEFILRLFEQEVPELSDGTIEIVAIARDPGVRSKIAVRSTRSDVDPVGACVGQRGSRVQQVVRELNVEKVDVIAWSDDPVTFITDAINSGSAEKIVVGVEIVRPKSEHSVGRAIVKVKKDCLAVAIGRGGVNADLANAITGYRLEVVPEGEDIVRDVADVTRDYLNDFLDQLEISTEIKNNIAGSPYNSVEALSKAQVAGLLHLVRDRDLALNLIKNAGEYFDAMKKLTRHTKKFSADSDNDTNAQ